MDKGTLVREMIDAGASLIAAFDKYAPVAAAFWIKESDSDYWFIYLISRQIDYTNFDLAYGEVNRILRSGGKARLDSTQVKVMGVDRPFVAPVLEVIRKYPDHLPNRFYHRALAPLTVEDVYIYPLPSMVPA